MDEIIQLPQIPSSVLGIAHVIVDKVELTSSNDSLIPETDALVAKEISRPHKSVIVIISTPDKPSDMSKVYFFC